MYVATPTFDQPDVAGRYWQHIDVLAPYVRSFVHCQGMSVILEFVDLFQATAGLGGLENLT